MALLAAFVFVDIIIVVIIHRLVFVIAVPGGHHILGRQAHEPHVLVVVGGARLADGIHDVSIRVDAARRSAGIEQNAVEQTVHDIRGVLADGLRGDNVLFQYLVALIIAHRGVAVQARHAAAVAVHHICAGQLIGRKAGGGRAQHHRRQVYVRILVQGRDAQRVPCKLEHRTRRHHIAHTHGHRIQRLLERLVHSRHAVAVPSGPVAGPVGAGAALAVGNGEIIVHQHGRIVDQIHINAQRVGRDALHGGTDLTLHLGAAVEAAVLRLLAKAAHDAAQLPLVIDDDAGRLRGDGMRSIVRLVWIDVIFNGHGLPILALQPHVLQCGLHLGVHRRINAQAAVV